MILLSWYWVDSLQAKFSSSQLELNKTLARDEYLRSSRTFPQVFTSISNGSLILAFPTFLSLLSFAVNPWHHLLLSFLTNQLQWRRFDIFHTMYSLIYPLAGFDFKHSPCYVCYVVWRMGWWVLGMLHYTTTTMQYNADVVRPSLFIKSNYYNYIGRLKSGQAAGEFVAGCKRH